MTDDSNGARSGSRLPLLDALRGVALIAMLLAHVVPFLPDLPRVARAVLGNINDVASPLFALVMGMTAALVWRRASRAHRTGTLVQQVLRGLILIALGVWMATWGTWVAIVLAHLGVLLLVGAPLLLLRTRWLIVIGAAVALASAPLNELARRDLLWLLEDPTSPLAQVASWVVLGQSYRLTNLLPFFLLGAVFLRHGTGGRSAHRWLIAGIAAAAYLVEPILTRLTGSPAYPSGSYPDTLHDAGLVLAVFAAVAALLAIRRSPAREVVDAIGRPVQAVGTLALSLYVFHVGLLAVLAPNGARPGGDEYLPAAIVVLLPLVGGYLWWRFLGAGPVERVMRVVTRWRVRPSLEGPAPRPVSG